MALSITQEQYNIAKAFADAGDYAGGWSYLASIGDNYADNAYAVTSKAAVSVDDLAFQTLVQKHWTNTAGEDAYAEKFTAVAAKHFQQYVYLMGGKDGYKLPDSAEIEKSYRDAVEFFGLPATTAFDGVYTRSAGDWADNVWPGSKSNGWDWTDWLGMEDERQVASTVFNDIDKNLARDTLFKDMWDTGNSIIGKLPFHYSLPTIANFLEFEFKLSKFYNQVEQGSKEFYNRFSGWASEWLLGEASSSFDFKLDTSGIHYNPIGAFYESTTAAADNSASIAQKTLVLLDSHNSGLSESALAARDGNGDGKLSGSELNGLSAWADLNENGMMDAGERQALAQAGLAQIRHTDYAFYTQGNSRVAAAAPVAPIKQSETSGVPLRADRTQGVPASNFRALRDTDNMFITATGYLEWAATQVKINSKNQTYLIGTDGADSFNANYYAAYNYFNSSLLVNFLAGGGHDKVGGSERSDSIWGGDGNDLLFGYAGDDKLYGEDGDDELQGQDGADYLDGGVGADRLFGGTGHDVLNGADGADVLLGEDGEDSLYGGRGEDVLVGGDGNDTLDGGDGNDELSGEAGDDVLFGGDGTDELQGGAHNDRLLGEAGDDRLFGQVGNDTLWGGAGNDILMGFTAVNEAKQSLLAGETDNDTLYGGVGTDYLYGGLGDDWLDGGDDSDVLAGNEGNDTLFGGAGDDELQGSAGNDQLLGEAGNDKLFGQVGNDVLWGGDGNDILVGFTGTNEAKQSLWAGESDNDTLYGGAGNDLMLGGVGDDTLLGESGADELQGGAGSDLLYGGEGHDKLFGQVGNDVLYGGDGNDILVGFTAYNETKQHLLPGESDNDWLYGGAGNDTLLGGVGNDYLDGGAGADLMEGGAGDDVYIVNSVNDSTLERKGDGYDVVVSSSNYLLNANIEELRLVEGLEIHGTGNALDNTLIGNSRNNILDGVTGKDTMIGGAGDDTYYVDNLGDKAIELAGEGVDTVQSSISYSLGDNVEHLMLLDFDQAEKGLVDGQATLVYGYPKANELDYMQGDAVEDFEGTCALTAIANLLTQADRPTTEKDVIAVAVDNRWAVTDPTRPAYERGGSNFIQQQALLNSFGLRNDLLAGYNEQGVANLVRSGRGVILAVNAGQLWDDPAYTGSGAVNHVVTVTGAVYSEASGELMGFYIADSGRQKVSDMTRYISLADFRRAANVSSGYAIYTLEPLKLWNEDIDGTGNSLDNRLVGNRGDNTLSGGAGNDTLSGGAGTDRLEGGTGNDTYLFNLGDGHDSIVEVGATPSTDILKFGAGISAGDIEVGRERNNLVLKHRNGQDQVSLIDWFITPHGNSNDHRLSRVEFADGTQWSREDLMRLMPDSAGADAVTTTLRYLIDPSPERDLLDLRTEGARYTLNGVEYGYRLDGEVDVVGSSGANSVWVAPGVSLNARELLGGEDRIFFTGAWADYSKTLDSVRGTITFSRTVDGQVERATVGNGQIALNRDLLVFADGSVRTDTVRKTLSEMGLAATAHDLKTQGALTTTTADDWNTQATSANPGALMPDTSGGSARALVSRTGNFAPPTAGLAQVLTGATGVDQVFVTPGATVDARLLLGGEDRIFLTGSWADYQKTLDNASGIITFTREVDGKTEQVTVGNGQIGLTRDLLVFADGAVRTDTVRLTLTARGLAASVEDLKAQGALSATTADDWRSDTFTGGTDAALVTIDSVSDDNQVNAKEKAAGVTVSGRAEVDSTVDLTWGGSQKQVTTDASGKWSATFFNSEVPTDGDHTITATATDKTGKVSASDRAVFVDTVAPDQPTCDPVTGDNRINAAERTAGVTLTGNAVLGSMVRVDWIIDSSGPKLTKTVAVDAAGRWSATFASSELPANVRGEVLLQWGGLDKAGNASHYSRYINVEPAAFAAPANDTMASMVIAA